MAVTVQPPGWYPDATASGLQWWNGAAYTGQAWSPDPAQELFDVVLLHPGVGFHLALRGTMMRLLGLPKAQAKALVDDAPTVVAVRLPHQNAEMLAQELARFGGSGGTEVHRTGFTAGTYLASLRAPAAPAAVPAAPPAPAPAAPPAPPAPAAPAAGPDPRFAYVEAQVVALRAQRQMGVLTPEQLDQAVAGMVFESAGRHWILGVNSNQWYASDGGAWAPANPPGR